MNTSHLKLSLSTISRTEFFTAQGALCFGKFGGVFIRQTGIVDFDTTIGNEQVFNANINTNTGIRFWQDLIFKFAQARYKVTSSAIFGNGNSAWFAWQLSRPTNIKRFFAFSNIDFTIGVFECTFGKFSRLFMRFLFECWIFGTTFKEVLKSRLLVSKSCLLYTSPSPRDS